MEIQKRGKLAQQEKRQERRRARSVAQGVLKSVKHRAKVWTAGDEPQVAAARWRSANSSARVDKTGSQSCVIVETRCRAKLHGIFKQAQRWSKGGRCFLLLGRFDQLAGSQIARLSSLRIVILSEVLSPGFDLNSSFVRKVLRGWIAHGDIAAVWVTQPLTSSTAAFLLKACHQANVVGFCAELSSVAHRQSLVHWATNNFVFQQVPVDLCAFGLPFKKRFTLFSVKKMFLCTCSWPDTVTTLVTSAPFLAQRIDSWDPVLKIDFFTDRTEFDMLFLWLVHWFTHSLYEQAAVVRLNHGQGHRWSGRGMQCAVIRAESR